MVIETFIAKLQLLTQVQMSPLSAVGRHWYQQPRWIGVILIMRPESGVTVIGSAFPAASLSLVRLGGQATDKTSAGVPILSPSLALSPRCGPSSLSLSPGGSWLA